jgi:hypothetical protein
MATVVKEQLKRNSILFWYGLINIFFFVFCFGISLFDKTEVLGKNAWYNPMKYYLSIGIFIWSMGWYLYFLNNIVQRKILTWCLLIISFIQTSIVLLQSIRGLPSFYTNNTPFNNLVFNFQLTNYVVFFVLMLVITYLFYFQKKNSKSQHFTWGIRLGMIVFLTGLLIGFYMLINFINANDNNYNVALNEIVFNKKKQGNFIIPFFLGIHGLQIIPLLSYYFFQNKKQVVNFTLLYFIMMIVLLFMAFINLAIF